MRTGKMLGTGRISRPERDVGVRVDSVGLSGWMQMQGEGELSCLLFFRRTKIGWLGATYFRAGNF